MAPETIEHLPTQASLFRPVFSSTAFSRRLAPGMRRGGFGPNKRRRPDLLPAARGSVQRVHLELLERQQWLHGRAAPPHVSSRPIRAARVRAAKNPGQDDSGTSLSLGEVHPLKARSLLGRSPRCTLWIGHALGGISKPPRHLFVFF